ncbi:MAG: LPS export ABC transporter periplasmic protein LptC [Alphaproteobacteria bacterium]
MVELTKEEKKGREGRVRLRIQIPRPRPLAELASRNHSSFVGLMKILLPAVAVGIVLLVVAWPQFQLRDEGFHIGLASITQEDVQNLRMLNPRYQGMDKRGEPFTVTARTAIKKNPQSDVVELDHPVADIMLNRGNWVALKGDFGVYREQDQQLDLIGTVQLYQDDGYEFETLAAHVNLADNTAEGDDPVHGQGPAGDIHSEGFRVYDKGQSILFTGRAHLILRAREEGGRAIPNLLPDSDPKVGTPGDKGHG